MFGLLVSMAVSGCQSADTDSDSRMSIRFGSDVGLGAHRDNLINTFVVGPICLTGPGKAQILEVTPVTAEGGVAITDFSVFPFEELEAQGAGGQSPTKLSEAPAYQGATTVTERCPPSGAASSQLALELTRPSLAVTATAYGVRITYELDGRRQVESDLALALCSEDAPTCPEFFTSEIKKQSD